MRPFAAMIAAALFHAAGATALAQETAVSEEKRAIVEELVKITEVEQMGENMLVLLVDQLMPLLLEANPGESEKLLQIVREETQKAMQTTAPRMVDLVGSLWAKHFELEELQQLLDFYKSEIGQKLIEKQPLIMQEATQAGAAIGQEMFTLILQGIKQRLQQEDLVVPQAI